MSQINTYLSREDYERLLRICEEERCSSYTLAKIAILDKIHNYTLKEKSYTVKGREAKQLEESRKAKILKPSPDEKARGIAEGVRKFL